MMADFPISDSTLTQKFQALYEFYSDFAEYVTELHANLPIQDDASRAAFSSMSRVMAFSDQMNLMLNLMREDVRVAGELAGAPPAGNWADQIEQSFLDWLRASRAQAQRLN